MTLTTLDEAAAFFQDRADLCRETWLKARWSDGVRCGHCNAKGYIVGNGSRTRCKNCRGYYNDLTGSLLHGTQLDLSVWMTVIWANTQIRPVSGRQIAEALGASPNAVCRANNLVGKIREGLQEDESWWGGDRFHLLLSALTNGPRAREAA